MPDRLTFVHLSDIHFRKGVSETNHDLDQGLRDAIEQDLQTQLATLKCGVDGILVTGDIAFAGNAEEYAIAKTWLKALAAVVGADAGEVVFCVPGNHDVDRKAVSNSLSIQDAQKGIRSENSTGMDGALSSRLKDEGSGRTLFLPITKYNEEFAWGFECSCTPKNPYWEHDLTLNDGSRLRLRGLTSTLLSGKNGEDRNDLFLGRMQTAFRILPDMQYLTLCHHPPDWCRDQDAIEDDLVGYAKIQLFGHKHKQRIRRYDNTVRVVAGAVHPERKDDWKPGYNLFQVWVEGVDNDRILQIEIHAREWQEAPPQFKAHRPAEGGETWKYAFQLPTWTPAFSTQQNGASMAYRETDVSSQKLSIMPGTNKGETAQPSVRSLLLRFSELPFHKQSEIVSGLGLVEDEDKGLNDIEKFLRAFRRANERKMLSQLAEEISRAESA